MASSVPSTWNDSEEEESDYSSSSCEIVDIVQSAVYRAPPEKNSKQPARGEAKKEEDDDKEPGRILLGKGLQIAMLRELQKEDGIDCHGDKVHPFWYPQGPVRDGKWDEMLERIRRNVRSVQLHDAGAKTTEELKVIIKPKITGEGCKEWWGRARTRHKLREDKSKKLSGEGLKDKKKVASRTFTEAQHVDVGKVRTVIQDINIKRGARERQHPLAKKAKLEAQADRAAVATSLEGSTHSTQTPVKSPSTKHGRAPKNPRSSTPTRKRDHAKHSPAPRGEDGRSSVSSARGKRKAKEDKPGVEVIVDAVLKELGKKTAYKSSDESSCDDDDIVAISSDVDDVEDQDPDEESMAAVAREGVSPRRRYRGQGKGKAGSGSGWEVDKLFSTVDMLVQTGKNQESTLIRHLERHEEVMTNVMVRMNEVEERLRNTGCPCRNRICDGGGSGTPDEDSSLGRDGPCNRGSDVNPEVGTPEESALAHGAVVMGGTDDSEGVVRTA